MSNDKEDWRSKRGKAGEKKQNSAITLGACWHGNKLDKAPSLLGVAVLGWKTFPFSLTVRSVRAVLNNTQRQRQKKFPQSERSAKAKVSVTVSQFYFSLFYAICSLPGSWTFGLTLRSLIQLHFLSSQWTRSGEKFRFDCNRVQCKT